MKLRLTIASLAYLLLSFGAHAAPGAGEVRLSAFKVTSVTDSTGTHEQLQTLQNIRPGDTIEYEAVYVNGADKTATNVQVTLPVPAGGLEYMPAVASVPGLQASLDGKLFQPVPLMRARTLADGRKVTQAVPPAEYRFLRWALGDLPAGATRSMRARMQLPSLGEPALALAR